VVESIEMPREPRVCGALGLRHLALIGDDDAGFPLILCLRICTTHQINLEKVGAANSFVLTK
jgi:hypothetical protein